MDGHRPTGAQAHLHPLAAAVEEGDVLERRGLEVRGQLAVHHVQDVAVELRGHTRCVVVGGLDHLRLLDQVGAEQEVIGGPQERPHVAQERTAAAGWEVPDRAAQQGDEARPLVGRARNAVEVALEVADDTVDLEPVVLVHQLHGGLAHHALGHVERQVAAGTRAGGHGVEQQPRLGGGARAKLDQLHRGRRLHDRHGGVLEDRHLRPGRVVLGQVADPLEQRRAARVVEVLGRDLLERPGEAVEHVVGEPPLGPVGIADVHVDANRRVLLGQRRQRVHASLAILMPAKICRRWGWSQLRKVGVATCALVAHEPPRSTRQSPPKKTSEYSR